MRHGRLLLAALATILSACSLQSIDQKQTLADQEALVGMVSLWPDTAVPATIATGDSLAIELGLKFESSAPGAVAGVRFYKAPTNTGTHLGSLWTASGTLLASVTFANETASGWQNALFSTPVTVQPGTVYVVSYFAPNGQYAGENGYFASAGRSAGPLYALRDGESGGNGVYLRSSTGGFPTSSYQANNYGVDLLFVPNTGNGLTGEYFDDQALTDLKLTRLDRQVNFDWGRGSPDPSIAVDTFSARWTGQVLAPVSGTVLFTVNADDGARLWIGNQLLIDWGKRRVPTAPLSLVAGRRYDLKLEYFQSTRNARVNLAWTLPGQAMVTIPSSNLFPSAASTCAPSCSGKQCGSDGCGGACGACASGSTCSSAGLCLASCTPSCSGKQCGSDGCGGTCGACASGQSCSSAGLCQASCVPSCSGKQCGSDGCGGTCGSCALGQSCTSAGLCLASCAPSCSGKQCGSDGCGGTCGSCASGSTCTSAGLCQASCAPSCSGKQCGPDGCGGTCGSCASGSTCSSVGQCTASPSGPQYYVATTGNDANPGTLAQPWRTIQKAMNSAVAGDTVNIRGGTYQERLTLNVSGVAGKAIVFQPYGWTGPGTGEAVVLDYKYLGTVTDGVPFLMISSRSYVRIQGLTFQNYSCTGPMQQGLRIDGSSSFVEVKDGKFLNNKNTYPTIDGTSAFLHLYIWSPAHDITISGNELGNINTNMSEAMTVAGASGVILEGNYFHDTDATAIDIHGGASGVTVRGNILEYIGKRRDGTVWYNNPTNAIYVDGGTNTVIERNEVRDSEWAFSILSEPGQPAAHDIVVRNNLAYRNYAGLFAGTWYSSTDGSTIYNVQFLNNTLYGNSNGMVIRPYTSSSVVWKNNIVANTTAPVVNSLGWPVGLMDYNLYFGGGAAGPDVHKVTADPLFTNASTGDFSLRSGSAAVDAGDSPLTNLGSTDFAGNPRIVGTRVDVGAYERQ
ncbi:MAG TPA: DUF4082 domain-containing protein [Myxococcales bacterium]